MLENRCGGLFSLANDQVRIRNGTDSMLLKNVPLLAPFTHSCKTHSPSTVASTAHPARPASLVCSTTLAR